MICFFVSSRRRHTRYWRDWSSDVCSSDLMRQHADLDQRIAGRAVSHSRATFAFQAQNLTVPRARRDADVKRGAIGEDERLLAAIDGIQERQIEMVVHILATPAAARATVAAKDFGED